MMIDAVIPGSKTMYEEQNEDDESKKMQLLLPQSTPAHQMKLTTVAMQQTDEPWKQQGKQMTDLDVSVITDKNYHLFQEFANEKIIVNVKLYIASYPASYTHSVSLNFVKNWSQKCPLPVFCLGRVLPLLVMPCPFLN